MLEQLVAGSAWLLARTSVQCTGLMGHFQVPPLPVCRTQLGNATGLTYVWARHDKMENSSCMHGPTCTGNVDHAIACTDIISRWKPSSSLKAKKHVKSTSTTISEWTNKCKLIIKFRYEIGKAFITFFNP